MSNNFEDTEQPFVLEPHESIIRAWHPQFSNFLLAVTVKSLITCFFLGPLGGALSGAEDIVSVAWIMLATVLAMAFYTFIYDDFSDWRKNKEKTWFLTNMRVVVTNDQDSSENISIGLSKIKKINSIFFWRLFIRPYGPGAVEVAYVKAIRAMRRQILNEKKASMMMEAIE